jgi:hypothetical protein
MAELKIITFEGSSPEALYDMSVAVSASNLVLVNYRIDLDVTTIFGTPATFYANLPKSIDIEIGTTVGSHTVIDNDPSSFYFKLPLEYNLITINARQYLISSGQPNIGFKMQNDIQRQCKFSVRDSLGKLLDSGVLKYYCFNFQLV